jgi:hypothetical protein
MNKDWRLWTIYINRHHFSNWAIGIDYYHEYTDLNYPRSEVRRLNARICQINLLFFNITITRWVRWI